MVNLKFLGSLRFSKVPECSRRFLMVPDGSGKFQGRQRVFSGQFQGRFREGSGKVQGRFMEASGKLEGRCRSFFMEL